MSRVKKKYTHTKFTKHDGQYQTRKSHTRVMDEKSIIIARKSTIDKNANKIKDSVTDRYDFFSIQI